MRKILRSGPSRFELLGRGESLMVFRDEAAAMRFLGPLGRNPGAMKVLRDEAEGRLEDPRALKTEELLEKFAALLVSGKVRILRTGSRGRGGSIEEGEETAAEGTAPPPPRNTSWIEIYLRDSEGNPVPGQKYQIKLPDGSLQEGILDSFGHAEYYDINPGSCEVTFPDLDAGSWEKTQ